MWSVVLKILSILGIILLSLLALVLTAALLVLFWPVSYRGAGTAKTGEYRACFRFRWLFGLVRGTYTYPEDGKLRIKALWITVYESGGNEKSGETPKDSLKEPAGRRAETPETRDAQAAAPEMRDTQTETPETRDSQAAVPETYALPETTPPEQDSQEKTSPEQSSPETASQAQNSPQKQPSAGNAAKVKGSQEQESEGTIPEKKKDLKNLKGQLLSYLDILRNKDNQELIQYGLERLGKIIRHIRPRYLRVQALAGLGEPDLTGYAYGIYCAVRPFLGKKCQVKITPDFERRILEGEAALRGRIMAATVLYHVCQVLLDKRLRRLTDQLRGRTAA